MIPWNNGEAKGVLSPTRRPSMSALLKSRLTAHQYLTLERRAEFKSEFYKGEMFAMAGASFKHNDIKDALIAALRAIFKDGRCRTLSSDQRVLVDRTGLYTYPDIVILCGPGEFDPNDADTLVNPAAIIEILSPSTEKYDRGLKFRNYQQIPSLTEYVLVAQDEPVIDRYIRQADGSWALISFVGLADTLAFTSVPASVPLAEVYSGVDFSEASP